MKTIIKLFICISLIYTPFLVFAGAAEKWDYEPVMKNMNIEVKAHKVDQYGTAVNDYEYNTKIDPKTDSNRTKMGKVGFGRLLRISGWGLLGYEALSGLLQAVDWILDPEAQSIWRYKPDDSGGLSGCIYYDDPSLFNRKVQLFYYNNFQSQTLSRCPIDSARAFVRELQAREPYQVEFTRWVDSTQLSKIASTGTNGHSVLYFVVTYTYSSGTKEESTFGLQIKPDPNQKVEERPKEYLTPEELADYANHTHPDYSNPELAPKLEPKYSPEIASDLWKPSNPWEQTNSPTVQEVNKKLDEAQPEPKKDPEITPNPETGGMTLPSFCTWAAPVCEYFKWAKQDDDLPDDEKPEIKDLPTPELKEDAIRWSSQCPADVQVPITMQGVSSTITFSWSPWCQLLSMIKPAIIASAYIGAAFIVLGLRT